MLPVEKAAIDRLTASIHDILQGGVPEPLCCPAGHSGDELEQLYNYMNRLISAYNSFALFLFHISRGDLDAQPPMGGMQILHSLKNLQANLRHLTWKTQEIARGDFSQRVDFMGEFSASFNFMVGQLAAAREELLEKNQELDRVSRIDPLTGLANRRGAAETLEREVHRVQRSEKPFAIVLADIDHFKRINDSFGHDAGDAVLVRVAEALSESVRGGDLCARWGGEEFLVLLAGAQPDGVIAAADRLRRNVEAARVSHNGTELCATISAGVSLARAGEEVEACIKRSDLCLYRAKESGRNQVWFQETAEALPRRIQVTAGSKANA